jgi:hypothetical protein
MFKKAEEEFGSSVGRKAGDQAVDAAAEAAAKRFRPKVLLKTKKNLQDWVTSDANRPVNKYEKVFASVAYEGLRRDYMRLCTSTEGGLDIVYDEEGTGKSYALQAVARAQSAVQPRRFLCINMKGTDSCQSLYDSIKLRVLGDVQDFEFTPREVAEIIKYGLCGPPGCEISSLNTTSKKCRLEIDAVVGARKKRNEFPILVIDEFNPDDFTWEKEYTMGELRKKIGDAFSFFNALTGEAHSSDGFVAFVGTKSEAFARALHKINGGTKAALAQSTTIEPSDGRPFSDWRGIQWTTSDKEMVVRGKYEEKLKQAFHQQGLSEDDVNIRVMNCIQSASSLGNIRFCCERMARYVEAAEENAAAKIQSRPQKSPTAAGCVANFTDQVQDNCAIM